MLNSRVKLLMAAAMLACGVATQAEAQTNSKYDAQFIDWPTYDGSDLELTVDNRGTHFRMWSPKAEAVELRLYSNGATGTPCETIAMTRDVKTGTWVATKAEKLYGRGIVLHHHLPRQAELGLVGAELHQTVLCGAGVGLDDALRAPVGHAHIAGHALLHKRGQALQDVLHRPGGIVAVQPVDVHTVRAQVVQTAAHVVQDLAPAQAARVHGGGVGMSALRAQYDAVPAAPVLHPAADHLLAAALNAPGEVAVDAGGVDEVAADLHVGVHELPCAALLDLSAEIHRSQRDDGGLAPTKFRVTHANSPLEFFLPL